MLTKEEIVTRIGIIRSKAGLSARELSLRIGKNSAYISRLESKNDSFEPSISALLEIIEACGSTPSEFFYYDISTYSADQELIDMLKTTTQIKKESIKNLLKM